MMLMMMLMGLVWSHVSHAETPFPTFDTLYPAHPRLLIHEDAWQRAKERIARDADARERHEGILRNAEKILEEPPAKYERPDGRRLLSVSRRVLDRSMTLAYAFRMTGDPRYRDRLAREMDAVCRFPDWNHHTHYLDVAEMAYAVALAYDWLFDAWNEQERRQMREALIRFAIEPTLAIYRGERSYFWLRNRNNWNFVCNGGILAAALALAEPGQEQPDLEEVLRAGFESIRPAYKTYEPDGAWPEGPGYWGYATMYAVAYVALLDSALGDTYGLEENQAFMQTVWAQLWHVGPTGEYFNYADSGSRVQGNPYVLWLAHRTGHPEMAYYHFEVGGGRYRLSPSPLDIFWHVPKRAYQHALDALPHARFLGRVNVFAFRSRWDDPDALYVAMQAGSNREGHAHLDVGTFVLDALGKRWALDLGSERQTYLMHQYPRENRPSRWDFYRTRAEGHNTLVINPSAGPDQDPKGTGRKILFRATPDGMIGVADLTDVYAAEAARVWRGLRVLNRREVVIQDEVKLKRPGTVWWFLHTAQHVAIAEDGRTATLQAGDAVCDVTLLRPANARLEVMDARPLPSSPDPPKQRRNEGVRKLAIHLEDVEETTIVLSLIPRKRDATASPPSYRVQPLDRW